MVKSMTGFARVNQQHELGHITWEVRSVNHRYLEVNWRLPESFRELEQNLRELLPTLCQRGKFDCTLKVSFGLQAQQEVRINEPLAVALTRAADQVAQYLPDGAPLSLSDAMKWPGMIELIPLDLASIKDAVVQSFQQALIDLSQVRDREGARLKSLIIARVEQAAPLLEQVKAEAVAGAQLQRDKLMARFEELAVECDPQRLEQELVYLAQKADIAEELDRLQTHFDEIYAVLSRDEAIGRRLDFLMQECHREANTLAAKAQGKQATQLAVDMKVLIEQMREQVQNIE